MKHDNEIAERRQWDVVRVSPNVVRAFEGGDGAMVQEFWTE